MYVVNTVLKIWKLQEQGAKIISVKCTCNWWAFNKVVLIFKLEWIRFQLVQFVDFIESYWYWAFDNYKWGTRSGRSCPCCLQERLSNCNLWMRTCMVMAKVHRLLWHGKSGKVEQTQCFRNSIWRVMEGMSVHKIPIFEQAFFFLQDVLHHHY